MLLELFPAEMRGLRQWACAGAGDPSSKEYKAPICPATKRWASVTDPSTWGTLEEALAAGYPLVGFMFNENDPFAVIDLDTYKAPNEGVRSLHGEIQRHAETYSETSQSGLGTHIIGYGSVPEGARNEDNAIEIYSHARFMICTGNTRLSRPLTDIQPLLDYLYPLVKKSKAGTINWRDLDAGLDSGLTDAEVVERAMNAENGDKFLRLCQGDLTMHGGDWSKADAALMQFFAFYSTDNVQVARLFMMSELAKRDKAHDRPDYVPRTIAQARARLKDDEIPAVDASAIIERGRAVAASVPPPAPVDSAPTPPAPIAPLTRPASFPPGLVGEIAQYALDAATRPVPDIALATAIAVVAGIVARNYNCSSPPTGLNQYILLLAKTGTGKESVQSSIDRLFVEVQKTIPAATRFLGPAAFASGPALVKRFNEQPCFVSVLGEFGHRIKAMSDPRAAGPEKTLMAAYLDIYSKSGWGQMLRESAYSDKEKNTAAVHAPCLTLLAETAPEPFFAGLSESLIESGFLPRFLTIEYTGDRPERNTRALSMPPPALVDKVAGLCASVLQMEQNNACHHVAVDAAGQHMLDLFDKYVDEQMRGAGEVTRQLWNRAHLKALRLASLIAVGNDPYSPVVTSSEATWAINMVKRDVAVLHSRFISGDVGEGDGKLRADLVRIIRRFMAEGNDKYADYHNRRCMPIRMLTHATASRSAFKNHRLGANRALKETLEHMVGSGELSLLTKQQARDWFKTTAYVYAVGDAWNDD